MEKHGTPERIGNCSNCSTKNVEVIPVEKNGSIIDLCSDCYENDGKNNEKVASSKPPRMSEGT